MPESPAKPIEATRPVHFLFRVAIFITIVIPFLGLVTAIVGLWGWGVSWLDLGLLLGFYLTTSVGVTVGFHRLFVHRSFETTRWIKVILAACGSMAVQGPLIQWVARHRRHHEHSDTAFDPHSPHRYGGGVWNRVRGFWHAHIGWAFASRTPDLTRYAADLRRSRLHRVMSKLFPAWLTLGLVAPAVLGGLLTGTWSGAATAFIWAGLVRVFLVHHVTWCINSVTHLWGTQPFRSDDQSRNNFVFGILGLGEGWHNAHHAFPTSARHGLRWWELDVSYWLIRLLALMGLAWNVRLPSAQAVERQTALAPADSDLALSGSAANVAD
jgi:stearoyl-CoA desaturase (delta-9 desaturase)